MMDMVTQAKALKISWVKRLDTAPCNTGWRQLVNIQFGKFSNLYYSCGLSTATIEHSCLSVCVCVCVCVSVYLSVYTITQKIMVQLT